MPSAWTAGVTRALQPSSTLKIEASILARRIGASLLCPTSISVAAEPREQDGFKPASLHAARNARLRVLGVQAATTTRLSLFPRMVALISEVPDSEQPPRFFRIKATSGNVDAYSAASAGMGTSIYVNGTTIDEPHVQYSRETESFDDFNRRRVVNDFASIVAQEGKLFVLGNNGHYIFDSRDPQFEFIDVEDVYSDHEPLYIYWSREKSRIDKKSLQCRDSLGWRTARSQRGLLFPTPQLKLTRMDGDELPESRGNRPRE